MSYSLLMQCIKRHKPTPQVVVVSKGQPAHKIEQLIAQGATDFAENRLPEIVDKWAPLLAKYPHITLHYVGALQSKKIKKILFYCKVLHTLDTLSAAQELAALQHAGMTLPQLYIQVNLYNEPHKRGIAPNALPALWQYLQQQLIAVEGLMVLPPPQHSAQAFEMLAQLAKHYRLRGLSMGMSDDYLLAIAHGSTCVRLGRIMFESVL